MFSTDFSFNSFLNANILYSCENKSLINFRQLHVFQLKKHKLNVITHDKSYVITFWHLKMRV